MWPWRRTKDEEREPAPLRGQPARPRIKTYSAASGYVFQYVYRGWRSSEAGTEHIFAVTSGAAGPFTATVVLQRAALTLCETRIGRPITPVEQYAVAKLSLFAGFDERSSPTDMLAPVHPSAPEMEAHLCTLGRLL